MTFYQVFRLLVCLVSIIIKVADGFHLDGTESSFAMLSKWRPCENGSISFEFRTSRPAGLLLYVDDGERNAFFILKLVSGSARLRVKLGSKSAMILSAGHNLNDREWHKVHIIRNGKDTTLQIDKMQHSRTASSNNYEYGASNKTYSNIFIGGIKPGFEFSKLAAPQVMFDVHFKGSFRNLHLSNCGEAPERPTLMQSNGILSSLEDLCEKSDPCLNKGLCLTTENGIKCDCSRTDFEGDHCEKVKTPSEATFSGTQYLSYDLSSRGDSFVSTQDSINLYFRTQQPDGLLFYTGDGGNEFFSISLRDGGIVLVVNLGSGTYETDIHPSEYKFDDNQWHHLVVKREAREITLEVDGTMKKSGTTSGSYKLLSSNIMYVAGSPANVELIGSKTRTNFRGCMKKVLYTSDSVKLDITDLARTGHDLIQIVGNVLFNKCQDTPDFLPVTFTTSDSFIHLPRWDLSEKWGTISFNFQTNEANGVILYSTGSSVNSDFIALDILGGYLYFIIDVGGGPVKVKATQRVVNDGLPHSVLIDYRGSQGHIEADGHIKPYKVKGGPNETLDLASLIYVGGISNSRDTFLLPREMWAGMLGYGYVGCIENLVVNGNKMDLARLARKQSVPGVVDHCKASEPHCLSRPCLHGGICSEGWNRFICDCRSTGFTGNVCQSAATTLHYDGTQYMKISLPEESHTEAEDISLRFRTMRPNGLLFMSSAHKLPDIMELYLEGGSLLLNINVGGGGKLLTVGRVLNNNIWHTVFIKRRAQAIELSIDGDRPVTDLLTGSDSLLHFDYITLGSYEPAMADYWFCLTLYPTKRPKPPRTSTCNKTPTEECKFHCPTPFRPDIFGPGPCCQQPVFSYQIAEIGDTIPGSMKSIEFENLELGAVSRDDNMVQRHTPFVGAMQQFIFNQNQFFELAKSGNIENIEVTATFGTHVPTIKHPVTFKSVSSYATLPSLQAYELFYLSFNFKTTEDDGLLFYNAGHGQDFIVVELVDGFLYYIYNMGAGTQVIPVNTIDPLNDNKWHQVSLHRPYLHQHLIRVDDYSPTVDNIKPGSSRHFNLEGPLYVGGVKRTMYHYLPKLVKSRTGFQGCLGSLDLNGYQANLLTDSESKTDSVLKGCNGPTVLCQPDSCDNNGICKQQWMTYTCDCDLTSYTGKKCTKPTTQYKFGPGYGLITFEFPENKRPNAQSDRIALGFSTTMTDAVIMRIDSSDSDDYLEMELDRGKVYVVYNMGTADHPIGESLRRVNDGKYHVVRFTRSGPNSTIQVDDWRVQTKTPIGRQLNVFNSQARVTIGARRTSEGEIERPFEGTISGLNLNGIPLLELAKEGDPRITMEGAVSRIDHEDKKKHPQPEDTDETETLFDVQSTMGVGETTPIQGVTDEIIYSGVGPGCPEEVKDEDCTNVGSGSEEDIILPTSKTKRIKPKLTTAPTVHDNGETTDPGWGTPKPVTDDIYIPPEVKPGRKINVTRPIENGNGIFRPGIKPTNNGSNTGESQDDNGEGKLNVGLIIGIVAAFIVAAIILVFALHKFRSRDEGSYKIDESQTFAYLEKKHQGNGALITAKEGSSKTGKKKDVKEWYV